jgi:hypothetical protein
MLFMLISILVMFMAFIMTDSAIYSIFAIIILVCAIVYQLKAK